MNNLHDLPSSIAWETPSLWFWMKAGAGFGIGFCFIATVFAFVDWLLSIGFMLSFLSALGRSLR